MTVESTKRAEFEEEVAGGIKDFDVTVVEKIIYVYVA